MHRTVSLCGCFHLPRDWKACLNSIQVLLCLLHCLTKITQQPTSIHSPTDLGTQGNRKGGAQERKIWGGGLKTYLDCYSGFWKIMSLLTLPWPSTAQHSEVTKWGQKEKVYFDKWHHHTMYYYSGKKQQQTDTDGTAAVSWLSTICRKLSEKLGWFYILWLSLEKEELAEVISQLTSWSQGRQDCKGNWHPKESFGVRGGTITIWASFTAKQFPGQLFTSKQFPHLHLNNFLTQS